MLRVQKLRNIGLGQTPLGRFFLNLGVSVIVLFVPAFACCQSNSSEWGPWIAVNDGQQNGVQISFRKIRSCNGPSCMYRWRFQNTYSHALSFDCDLLIVDARSRQSRETCAAGNLAPGQIKTNDSWWTYSTSQPVVVFRRAETATATGQRWADLTAQSRSNVGERRTDFGSQSNSSNTRGKIDLNAVPYNSGGPARGNPTLAPRMSPPMGSGLPPRGGPGSTPTPLPYSGPNYPATPYARPGQNNNCATSPGAYAPCDIASPGPAPSSPRPGNPGLNPPALSGWLTPPSYYFDNRGYFVIQMSSTRNRFEDCTIEWRGLRAGSTYFDPNAGQSVNGTLHLLLPPYPGFGAAIVGRTTLSGVAGMELLSYQCAP
jgi:hypothetical protein